MVFYIIFLLLWARVCYFICMCYFCSYEMVIMKNLFRTVSVIALAGWFLACSERKSEACYEIIPAPLEIRENFSGGEFVLDDGVCIVYPGENEAMRHNALFLADYLKAATGRDYRVETGSRRKKNVTLQLDSSIKNPEGYRVNVSAGGVVIAGASEAGVFYGIQTLRKAIPVKANSVPVLTAVGIEDEPRFGYRGVHLDVCRHFFTVDEVKKFIDMMVLHNMNRLHWHITDDQGWRIEIKKYPELTTVSSRRTETVIGHNSGKYDGKPYGGFYTQEQAREIVDYAAERYITVIPEVDLPGHMQAALAAYPYLGCTGGPYEVWRMWGVSEEVLCAGNDSVLTFIDDVLTEIMEIFPSEYIHVGGDECPKVRWEKCPKCQARIKALGIKGDDRHTKEEYLQSFIICHAEKFLNEHGRRMIGWDETLEGGLAPNATVMSWRGEGGGIEAARQHHDVIMTPDTYLYFNHYQSKDTEEEPEANGGYSPLAHVYGYEPIPSMLTSDEQKFIKGVQANHWTEYITTFPQLQYMALPRWAALCEIQWSQPEKKDYADFLERLLRLTRLYDALGYNYAKHIFDVTADYRVNTKNGTVDIFTGTIDDAPIHYTLDGTEPTVQSPVTAGVLSVSQSGTFRAMAVRPSGNSRVVTEKITFGKSTCKPIVANQPINEQYKFNGITTLVDGLQGNGNYKTGRWIAFRGNDMDVTIDLCRVEEISSVTFHNCVEKGDWIFDVRSVAIEVSEDGKNFERVFFGEYPEMQESDRNGLYVHKQTFAPVKARYMRIMASPENVMPDWHPGKGYPAFLFVDEIVVN